MKLKQLFCRHNFKPIDGYEDKKNNRWVTTKKCLKCNKEQIEYHYYPPKCKLTNKFCYEDYDNCKFCNVYVYKRYNL